MDPSPYAEQRYKDGLECARRAVQYDQQGHLSGALSFYSEAVEAFNHACSMSPAFLPIQPQVAEYSRRADELSRHLKSQRPAQGVCIYLLYRRTRIVVCLFTHIHKSCCFFLLPGQQLVRQPSAGTVDRDRVSYCHLYSL